MVDDPARWGRDTPRRPALLREATRILVVVAHPDDESFGLGGLLDRLGACGTDITVLCLTRGEASTLAHAGTGDLGAIRAAELRTAAAVLGVRRVELLDHPDGRLDTVAVAELAAPVRRLVDQEHPSHLLVFDEGGVTGHPDHEQATRAALLVARERGLPVLGWTVPEHVAARLNTQFGTAFHGRRPDEIDLRLSVSRVRQRRAITAHASQSHHNPVLHRRLALLRDSEHLRTLHPPANPVAT